MSMDALLAYYGATAGRAFLTRQAGWLLAAAALTAVVGTTNLDRFVALAFFDATQHTFPLTNNWWLKAMLHDAARTTSAFGALAILAATCLAWSTRWPAPLHAHRRELAFVSAALFVAAVIVGALKHFSAHACPWDVVDFGGSEPYLVGLASVTRTASVQGCLPAAHPLTGYAWLCVGLVLYPASAARARAAWLAAAALGTLFGLVQVARGAHFLSHVLWSAWIVWAVDLTLVAAWSTRVKHAEAGAASALATRVRAGH